MQFVVEIGTKVRIRDVVSLIHSFVRVFIEHLAYARRCINHWEYEDEKHKPCPWEFPFAVASFLTQV